MINEQEEEASFPTSTINSFRVVVRRTSGNHFPPYESLKDNESNENSIDLDKDILVQLKSDNKTTSEFNLEPEKLH